MAKHRYQQRRAAERDDDIPDDPDDLDDDIPEPPAEPRPRTGASRRASGSPPKAQVEAERAGIQPSTRMQDQEFLVAYVVAAVLAVSSGVLAVLATSPINVGPDKHGRAHIIQHPSLAAPLVGLALAVVMAATVRRMAHRIVAGVLGMLSAFALSVAAAPHSLRQLQTVVFLVPLVFALWMTMRQSRSQKANKIALAADRHLERRQRDAPAAKGQAKRAKKGGRQVQEPSGIRPNSRYTPPKARSADDDRRGRRSRS